MGKLDNKYDKIKSYYVEKVILGKGRFGEVRKASKENSNEVFAIKSIIFENMIDLNKIFKKEVIIFNKK
jgi:hypothetical protein